MNSTHGIELAAAVIENDPTKAEPLLKLLHAFATARGDPLNEAMTQDVMMFLYSKTEHCEQGLTEFISQAERLPLVA
jgi:hypothetical protein